jgi:hypothetical protein
MFCGRGAPRERPPFSTFLKQKDPGFLSLGKQIVTVNKEPCFWIPVKQMFVFYPK